MAYGIPERVIEEVRFRSDIVDVIGQHVTLKRTGGSFKACCPFHQEKTPSFTVNPQRQSFKCFGCGAGGNVFTFLMKHQGVDFVTAVKILAQRAGLPIDFEEEDDTVRADRDRLYKLHGELTEFYERCLQHPEVGEVARAYLAERQLDAATVTAFRIGFAPDRWDAILEWGAKHKYTPEQLVEAGVLTRSDDSDTRSRLYDRFRNRVMFPIQDGQSRVIGFSGRLMEKNPKAAKYLNSPETPIFRKSRVLYAFDKARQHIVSHPGREALVCEGQIDVIRCHQAGFRHAVASQGTAFTTDHAAILKRYADGVVICFDPDKAGQDASVRTAVIFMDQGLLVRVAQLPPGADPDAYILKQGRDAFQQVLDQALSVIRFQARVLRGRETDPDSTATVTRVSRALLETISHSPNAVQRAKLLEEAAAELNVPPSALSADLAPVEERLKTQQARTESRRQERERAHDGPPDQPPPDIDAEADTYGAPDDDGGLPASYTREERAVCEHLAHVLADASLLDLVRQHLPLELLRYPPARAFVALCLSPHEDHHAFEAAVDQAAEPGLREFAGAVMGAPLRLRGEEATHAQALREAILRLWTRHLQRQCRTLDAQLAQPGGDEDLVLATRSAQLRKDIKTLERWETGSTIIAIHMAEEPPT